MGVVLVLLGLTVQAGAAQVPMSQGVTADGTADAADAVAVETTWADTGADSSYYVGGNVTYLAADANATVWFEYRVAGANSWETTRRQSLAAADRFDAYLTGLTAGETYEYRARAEAGNDTVSGAVLTFTSGDESPAAATRPPERITEHGATLNGYVEWLAGADSAEVFFVVSPVGSDEQIRTATETVTEIGPVNRTFGQLEPDTTYEYALHVRAADGHNTTGSSVQFTTDSEFAVSTGSADVVNETALSVTGNVTDLGGAAGATATVEYRRADATEWSVAERTKLAAPSGVAATVTGLEPGTTYDVRVTGEAADGDAAAGNPMTVSTDADARPEAAVTGATDVTESSANLTATVTDLGGAESARVILYLRSADAEQGERVATRNVSAPADVSASVDGLAADSAYEYDVVVEASDGDVVKTDAATFTTDGEFDVGTESVLVHNGTAVTLTGNVTDFGGADAATLGFEYRRNGSTEWIRAGETRLDAVGSASETIHGLEPGTVYELRVTGAAVDGDQAVGGTAVVSTDAVDSAPEAATTGATNVTQHAATLTATVADLGGADRAAVDFQLRRVGADEWWTFETRNVSAPGAVDATFLDFRANATYEYRVLVAASDGDTATASPTQFTTEERFTARTEAVSSVNSSAVFVNGTVTDFAGADAAEVAVDYREADSVSWTTATRTGVSPSGHFGAFVTDLDENTQYEVRIRATASDGDVYYGEPREVTTRDDPSPLVATTGAADVTDESAQLTATVTDLGAADSAAVRFEIRQAAANEWRAVETRNVTVPADLRAAVGDLQANMTYEYRAVLTASDGDTATGGVETLTTDAAFAVETVSARAANDTAATVTGSVTDLGDAEAATVTAEYRRNGSTEWTVAERAELDAAGEVTAIVTGLEAGTDYEVRVTGQAADGDADAGRALPVRTASPLAVATTDAVAVNDSVATLEGDLTDLGGAENAQVSFEYRVAGADEWERTATESLDAAGSFDRAVSGLDASTTYEYRAVVETSDGERATGDVRTLTTESDGAAPEIGWTSIGQEDSPNPHLTFTTYWWVTDEDRDLASVHVEVIDDDGSVVDSATTDAHGDWEFGSNDFTLKHVDDEQFTVRITVTDESGRTDTTTRTVSE
ncbi:hypothetical protein [Halosimplex sp. J119]